MSAFGGKADMTIGTCPLSWSLSDVKQTSLVAAHMSAYDPKQTSLRAKSSSSRARFAEGFGDGSGAVDEGSDNRR
jgi:hypothetical protein